MESLHAPQPTTRQLMRRLAISFIIAFVALTSVLLANYARMHTAVSERETWKTLWLALPFNASLTIPMAAFIAVLYVFTRLGANGTLDAARRLHDGVRRLVVPVLAAAFVVAALAFVVTAEIVPRTNAQLTVVKTGGSFVPNDRSMTIGELREAARNVQGSASATLSRVAAYEVEVQKKIALPAACIVLALVGMAITFRIPRGGVGLVVAASFIVFGAYYMLLMGGETLADQLVVSPFVAMWGANAILLTVALLALWQRRTPFVSGGHGSVVIGD